MKDDFFIGWQESPPKVYIKSAKLFFVFTLALSAVIVCIYIVAQKGYKNSRYKIGEITSIQGTFYAHPKPNLVTQEEKVIFLTGKGKFGAEQTIANWELENSNKLDGKQVTLQGTTASYNGVTFLELALQEASIALIDGNTTRKRDISNKSIPLELSGELVDPKCYFGAMKPGFGKIHKSCAIRCLSGGIPPVLVSEKGDYYMVLLQENTSIEDIAKYIGKNADFSGMVKIIDGISYLTLDNADSIVLNDKIRLDQAITLCKN